MSSRYFEKEDHVQLYCKYRVQTPTELHQHVMSYLKEKYVGPLNVAIDVGCGSGQNTFGYCQYFNKVWGVDVSPNQIAVANEQKRGKTEHANVEFRESVAEKLEFLEDNSVQLVTVNSAIHWFDVPVFFNEVLRILSPNGVLAISSFKRPTILSWEKNPSKNEELTQVLKNATSEYLFAPPEIQVAQNLFKDMNFPENFVDLQKIENQFFMERRMSLEDLVGRKMTSSAYQKFREEKGEDEAQKLLNIMKDRLRAVIADELVGNPKAEEIYFIEKTPFYLILCRKSEN